MSTDAPVAPAPPETPQTMQALGSQWAAKQTATEPEVAPETPDASAETPAGEAAAPQETAQTPEAPEAGKEPARDEAGRFAKTVKAEHNGQVIELSEDTMLPYKVNGEMQTRSLRDILKANSAEGAIQQMRETVRLTERGARAEVAEAKAEAEALRGRLAAIRKNPNLALRLADDPEFAEQFDLAQEKLVGDARSAARQEASTAGLDQEYAQLAASWIQSAAAEFDGVDPDEVRVQYASYLASEDAQRDPHAFTPQRVKEFFQRAQGKAGRYTKPLQEKLSKQEQEIADLKAQLAALAGNGKAEHALKRAAAPPVLGGGAGGIAPGPKPSASIGSDGRPLSLKDATANWINKRQ